MLDTANEFDPYISDKSNTIRSLSSMVLLSTTLIYEQII